MNNRDLFQLCELVAEEFENDLSKEKFNTLNNMLKDKECAHKYVELISMLSELSGQSRADISIDNVTKNMPKDSEEGLVKELLYKIVDLEDNAPAIEIEREEDAVTPIDEKSEFKPKKSSKFFRLFDRFLYLAAVFMIMFVIYAEVFSPQYTVQVATVVDQVGVKWSKGSEQLSINDRVLTNQFPYRIDKGIVKIKYDQGVDVLIEGPAEFVIEKKGMDLTFGRVYSYVSETGRGFMVDTPNSRFVDLGTEFGVFVDSDDSSELHVLKGEVQYFSGLSGAPKTSKIIRQNNARKFDSKTGMVRPIPVSNEYFARHVDSRTGMIWRGQQKLDLVRILAGKTDLWQPGDAIGIHPVEAEYVDANFKRPINNNNKYNTFDSSEFIDGVFIPDGGKGEVTITSAGNKFSCPDTSGGFTNNICMFRSGIKRENSKIPPVIFNSVNKEEKPESIMCFHSNCGITIDLKAISDSMPGHALEKFNAWGGITEFVDGLSGRAADVDLWILVDGQVRYEKELLKVKDGIIDIDIDLVSDDRFLTIIVTDGLRETDASKNSPWANDFFYLVNPEIILGEGRFN